MEKVSFAESYWAEKRNSCHLPSGPRGGQFCSGGENFPTARSPLSVVDDSQLTSEDIDTLHDYKRVQYQFVNRYLYGETQAPEKNKLGKSLTKKLDGALERSRTNAPVLLFRGLPPSAVPLAHLPEGSTFSVKGFQSTSVDRRVAENFGFGGAVVALKVPRGVGAANMERKGVAREGAREREVLLRRGLRIRVEGRQKDGTPVWRVLA
jgi:hypothetical protein